MRAHHVAVAAAITAILATSACSAGSSARPPSTSVPLRDRLRDGLLTQAQLPHGFKLMTGKIDSTTTGAPHTPSTVPIASMPCSQLTVESFMTAHARPGEDVAVAVEQEPVGDDYGWFGQESLDRYAPGQAAAVMAAVRGVTQRCTAYTDALDDGTRTQNTVSVRGADVRADDSLVLRIASTLSGDTDPYITETGFVREGNVILMVQKMSAKKPQSGVETVLSPAVAAYRAATAG
ncbi:hypothetical protein [Streptomyces sp. NPDC002676]